MSTAAPLPPYTRLATSSLALLLAINLFNYIDRQVLSAVLSRLEVDPSILAADDPLKKTKLGWLTPAFLFTYMFASPIFGRLAVRYRRWALVGIGVIVWSLASGGSGLARSIGPIDGFWILLITRCLVGIGEAAYGPVAPAMISDLFPESRRGQMMAWFYMAIPVGSALGFVLGGLMVDTSWGWRGAFYLVVLPGILLGFLAFTMREPPRVGKQEIQPWRAVLKELRGIRSFVLCSAGMTFSTFVLGGVAVWVVTYIYEREARFDFSEAKIALVSTEQEKLTNGIPSEVLQKLKQFPKNENLTYKDAQSHLKVAGLTDKELENEQSKIFKAYSARPSMDLDAINQNFGLILVIGGIIATFTGGILGDKLRGKIRGAYFVVSGGSALVALPLYLAVFFVPFPLAWVFLAGTIFCLFLNTGPANTILANVTRSPIRATAFAINILIIHLLGDAISPAIIGMIADFSSLETGLMLVTPFILGAGVLWLYGARTLDEDTAVISQAEHPAPSSPTI
ncbi:MAG: MFS transporter [Zavarzinella sp.]